MHSRLFRNLENDVVNNDQAIVQFLENWIIMIENSAVSIVMYFLWTHLKLEEQLF